jgi:hypothetical protein
VRRTFRWRGTVEGESEGRVTGDDGALGLRISSAEVNGDVVAQAGRLAERQLQAHCSHA